jgi:hypothetical protein
MYIEHIHIETEALPMGLTNEDEDTARMACAQRFSARPVILLSMGTYYVVGGL